MRMTCNDMKQGVRSIPRPHFRLNLLKYIRKANYWMKDQFRQLPLQYHSKEEEMGS